MKGTITRIISNLCTVTVGNIKYDCHPRGKFYFDKKTPMVGDTVIIDEKQNYILDILPRKNMLIRPMIANIDKAIIVTSVKEPVLSFNLLDKLLSLIVHNDIEPIICLTKIDKLNAKEKKEILRIKKYYSNIGFKVVTNKQLKKLYKLIKNKTIVLCGQTGSGKSSLLNRLDKSLHLQTNEISASLGRGVHTTRHVELFPYKSALIADTPGFSSLSISDIEIGRLAWTFPEFRLNCQYDDCKHLKEPGCLVKSSVENGRILASRYENYLKFVRDR